MSDEPTVIKVPKDCPDDLAEVVKAAFAEKPDKKALATLEKYGRKMPEIVARFFPLAQLTQAELIKKIAGNPGQQTALIANITNLKNGLGYDDSPEVEKMLIESIVNCWMRYNWTEYQLTAFMGRSNVSFNEITWWEKRLTETQKRYLRAVEMLAKVRRLNIRNLQVNIANEGGQQVNVAGDLVRPA